MARKPLRFPWPRWPFYLVDALVIAAAAHAFLRGRGSVDFWAVASLVVSFAAGAFLSLLPHLLALEGPGRPSLPDATAHPPAEPESATEPDHPDDALADVAVLAWRIKKRAEQDPETQRVILRNAGKALEALGRCGVEVVSHLGRKIDVGSNVEILDAVDGEYNRVLEESDPQVQVRGRLVRRAIVTVGNGTDHSKPGPQPGDAAT